MVTGDGVDGSAQRDNGILAAQPEDLLDTLAAVTAAAVRLSGVDYAAVMFVDDDGGGRTDAATAPVVVELEATQLRIGRGPGLLAADTEAVVRCPDLRNDERWPDFAAAASAAGIAAMVSFPIYTHARGFAVFTVFSRTRHRIHAATEAEAKVLSTDAAIALIAADRRARITATLAARDAVSQAKGVVMERFDVDATRAAELLIELSRDADTSLRAVAARIIDTATSAQCP